MSAPHGPVEHGSVYNGMPANGLTGVTWHKSRCSSPQGECVEMARLATGDVAVRNSRHPDGPALVYTQAEIEAFVQGVKDGDFDQFVGRLVDRLVGRLVDRSGNAPGAKNRT